MELFKRLLRILGLGPTPAGFTERRDPNNQCDAKCAIDRRKMTVKRSYKALNDSIDDLERTVTSYKTARKKKHGGDDQILHQMRSIR